MPVEAWAVRPDEFLDRQQVWANGGWRFAFWWQLGALHRLAVALAPDGAYTINFNLIKPQAELSANADQIKVPAEPVIFLAYAKALAERGEDGGLSSSEAYLLYKSMLSDHIALEGTRYPDTGEFVAI